MKVLFTVIAAVGVTALAIWLPVREAQHESIQHYPSTQYIDVRPGATRTWHYVQWRMTTMRQIPWKYYNGASPPVKNFARLHILLHCRLVGPKAKLGGQDASDYLWGSLTKESFDYELRDRDERVWDPISSSTDSTQWAAYRADKGMDFEIYADVPAAEAGQVMLVVKYKDHRDDFNFSKTPSPRETVLRFLR